MCSRSKQKINKGKEEIYAARQFFSAAFPKRSFRASFPLVPQSSRCHDEHPISLSKGCKRA
jgi:hypothetical protein